MSNLLLRFSAWTPYSLGSSLVGWWDPDYGITKDGVSNRVSSWKDRISQIDVTQGVGANQPLWVAAATEMNSRPSIQFDAQPQQLAIASAPTAIRVQQQNNTYLAVARGNLDILGSDNVNAGSFLLMLFNNKVRAHVWYASVRTQDGLTTITPTTRGLVGQMADSNTLYPILNGVKDNVGVARTTAVTATAPFRIGWRGATSNASFLGYIGDVFIINRSLTDNELLQIYNWAKVKWAL